MREQKFRVGQIVKVISANEADDFYLGKNCVIAEDPNWDCSTWYYSPIFDEYAGDDEDCNPPYFREEELERVIA